MVAEENKRGVHAIETADSPRILIVSQSHTAVDNILEGLDKIIADDMQIIRIGADKNVSPKIVNRYTMPAHRDKIFETVPKNINAYNETTVKISCAIRGKGGIIC